MYWYTTRRLTAYTYTTCARMPLSDERLTQVGRINEFGSSVAGRLCALVGPDSARLIADALRGRRNHSDGTWVFNSSLRSLNLEFNSIGDEGIIAIAQARVVRRCTRDPTHFHSFKPPPPPPPPAPAGCHPAAGRVHSTMFQ